MIFYHIVEIFDAFSGTPTPTSQTGMTPPASGSPSLSGSPTLSFTPDPGASWPHKPVEIAYMLLVKLV
jgi:hypothetical protein